MLDIFLVLFLSHVIADFYLQFDSFSAIKDKKGFRSWQVYVHALIVWSCTWCVCPKISFWGGAFIIGISHLLMDGIKCYLSKFKGKFFIDQLFHLSMITLVACLYQEQANELLAFWGWNIEYVMYITGFLFICKPANIIIQNLFGLFSLQVKGSNKKETETLLQAGHIIGAAERIIAFFFILVAQYEALGFLIAAKSILRFRDADTARTEYVLVGTLLSFLIAIITALSIEWLLSVRG